MWSTVSSLVDATAGKLSRFSNYRNPGFDSSPSSTSFFSIFVKKINLKVWEVFDKEG